MLPQEGKPGWEGLSLSLGREGWSRGLEPMLTSALLPAASLGGHLAVQEAWDSDPCSSQNLFFIKMLCAPGRRGVKLICLCESVCLEHAIRDFVSFKIKLRARLSLARSPLLTYIADCRNPARSGGHVPSWEEPSWTPMRSL